MDMQKIGSFLAALRKERNLTQDELGAQIGVTNKTISRWETGSYLPPVEMLQTLGDTFGVSINEILNGERISDGNYKDISEQNLKSALTKSDSVIAKHRKIMNWVIAVVVAALYVTISLITLKWQYTWMIWAVYCAYRTVESIIIYRLNVHVKSK
jgi:transcriptional regulator with XRE-family HTH domain